MREFGIPGCSDLSKWTGYCFSGCNVRIGLLAVGLSLQCWGDASAEVLELEPLAIRGTRLSAGGIADRQQVMKGIQCPLTMVRGEDWFGFAPGLHLEGANSAVNGERVYLRGGEPNAALFWIDGVKVDNPTSSRGVAFMPSGMPGQGVDRVDVTYGAGSSVYGSGALSGLVAVESFGDWTEDRSFVGGTAGLRGAWSSHLRVVMRGSRGDGGMHGFQEDRGRPFEGMGHEIRRVTAAYDPEMGAGHELHFRGFWGDSSRRGFPEESGGPMYAVLRDSEWQDAEEWGASLRYRFDMDDRAGAVHVGAAHYRLDDNTSSPGVVPGKRDPFGLPRSVFENAFRRTMLHAHWEPVLTRGFSWLLGGGWERESGRSRSEIDYGFFVSEGSFDMDRDTASVFSEGSWSYEGLSVQVSARLDDAEGVDAKTLLGGGFHYLIPEWNSRLGVRYGEGFKMPGFFALANPLVGNSELEPERSESWQVIWDTLWVPLRVSTKVVYHESRYRDMIDFDSGPPPGLVNRGRVFVRGVDAHMDWRPSEDLRIRGFGAWLELDPGYGEAPLRGRPEWRVGMDIEGWILDNWRVGVRFTHTGKRFDSSIPTADVWLNGFERIDLRLSFEAWGGFAMAVGVENVLDQKYQEMAGFPGNGVSPWISMSLGF